jgi:hypothetical protein
MVHAVGKAFWDNVKFRLEQKDATDGPVANPWRIEERPVPRDRC